jgi:exonuclease V gamma subunit
VAEDKIYISYVGQNIKDNSIIPPSTAVIDELLATIDPLLEECKVER